MLSEQVRQLLNMVVNLQNENVRLRKEIDKSSLMGKNVEQKNLNQNIVKNEQYVVSF